MSLERIFSASQLMANLWQMASTNLETVIERSCGKRCSLKYKQNP